MRSKERVGRLEIGGVVRGWWWFVLLCCVQANVFGSKNEYAVFARIVKACMKAALLAQVFVFRITLYAPSLVLTGYNAMA